MTFVEANESLVILNLAPALEESLIDWLLAREGGGGFTSLAAQGHSTRHDHLSVAEQVSGRQSRQQFQIQMPTAAVEAFLEEIQAAFGGAAIHFWVLPIMQSGRFGATG